MEARHFGRRELGFQLGPLGRELLAGLHLVGVLLQEDGVELVELGLGGGTLGLE